MYTSLALFSVAHTNRPIVGGKTIEPAKYADLKSPRLGANLVLGV